MHGATVHLQLGTRSFRHLQQPNVSQHSAWSARTQVSRPAAAALTNTDNTRGSVNTPTFREQDDQRTPQDDAEEESEAPRSSLFAGFAMSRTLSLVSELSREWTVGINGQSSVQEADHVLGTKWRQSDKNRKHYQRRMIIIKEVQRAAKAQDTQETDIVNSMDDWRRKHNASLDRL